MARDPLVDELERATAPGRVLGGEFDRVAFASDASMYHLIPRAVVLAADETDVAAVLRVAGRRRVPVTFRAAGTSLSGQGVTDGILVEVARHWRKAWVEDAGRRIRARPGMIGAQLNALLAPHGTRLGPDPSSLAACTLGGILANNSSGPCSGVEQNSYHTLESLRIVLADGTVLSTSDADADGDADAALRAKASGLHAGLLELRRALLANDTLRGRVERKYRTKNTTGYGLSALLDFERPIDILAHLLIGSEGTLAFISEAVLRTVPLLPHTSTALLLFPSVHAACEGIIPFREAGTQLVELLDEASLRAIAHLPGLPSGVAGAAKGSAALLVQAQAANVDALAQGEAAALDAARRLSLLGAAEFTRDARRQDQLIHARKGLYPAVGGRRADGTSVLLEDVAFPVERLADGAVDLQRLFAKHEYGDGVIFGHAKDGNLHFLVTQRVGTSREVDRYARFLDDVVELVVHRHDGALKAEHGTGRNMAPFVESEWGADGLELMRRIKTLFDPEGVLNPGVILPASPRAHLEHLKTTPAVGPEVDACVECGYCEPVCPSRDLTLTPRQRIVVRRERARRLLAGDRAGAARLDGEWQYAGLDTCATDGMCATACPVAIDTGAYVMRQRAERRGGLSRGAAGLAASSFGLVTLLARTAVRAGRLGGLALPAPGHSAPVATTPREPKAIYFPSCTSRMLAGDHDPFLSLAARAEVEILVPEGLDGMCCGLAFRSKGFPEAAETIGGRSRWALIELGKSRGIPVVADGSSCEEELDAHFPGLAFNSVIWTWRELLPKLTVRRKLPDLALHIPCSARYSDVEPAMRTIAHAIADRVFEPRSGGCCGFAGDRGITHPELTASATAAMAEEIRAARCTHGAGSNLPCQIAMSRATKIDFRGILALLDDATR